MKTRTFIFSVILILTVIVLLLNCATEKKAVKAPIEPLYGTWVNPDYNENFIAKIIFRPDGTVGSYGHTDITEGAEGTFTIIDSWIDSDGNKYYKIKTVIPGWGSGKYRELWRLNENGTVLEVVWGHTEYPTEIDPEHPRYRIRYRQ